MHVQNSCQVRRNEGGYIQKKKKTQSIECTSEIPRANNRCDDR